MSERVFITGVAAVLPGDGLDDVLRVDATRLTPTELGRPLLAARIEAPDLSSIPPLARRRMTNLGQIATVAARQSLTDAGHDPAGLDPERTAIVLGTGIGSPHSVDHFLTQLLEGGVELTDPLLFPNSVPNAVASQIAIHLRLQGPNATVSQREISGEVAIAFGMDWIRSGRADLVLVGGADELTSQTAHYVESLGQLAPADGEVRPLDPASDGVGLGEGVSFLVLEGDAAVRGPRSELLYADLDAAPAGPYGTEGTGEVLAGLVRDAVARLGSSPDLVLCGANGHPALDRIHGGALAEGLDGAGTEVRTPKSTIGEGFSTGVALAAAGHCALLEPSGPGSVLLTGAATGGAAAAVTLRKVRDKPEVSG